MQRTIFRIISKLLAKRHFYLIRSLCYKTDHKILPVNLDQVRHSSLVLCSEEIKRKNVPGNVAEVGVYKGDFAKRLNIVFGDRKLYLFDTFEGFSSEDVQFEQKNNFSTGKQDFSDTSIEVVRSKMKHPENCIFMKGKFPETAAGLEEEFCFVSLDADLYLPIYEGLKYFYPRLSSKGYIFIHDFNNEEYAGAREAVYQFCSEQKIGFTPIPDIGGTAIISKA